MKSVIAFIFLATFLAQSIGHPVGLDEEDNLLSPAQTGNKQGLNDFLKITKAPPARVAQPYGSTVELECEVIGSPIPIVQWVHGSGQQLDEVSKRKL